MSKIVRYPGNVQAFASQQLAGERTVFGDVLTESDLLADQLTADYLRGWGIVGPTEAPTMEDFNALGFTHGQFIAYLHQMGVPEWDSAQEYPLNAVTQRSGEMYLGLEDGNVGNDPALGGGGPFASDGTPLGITDMLNPSVTALDDSTVAYWDGFNSQLRTYQYVGGVWSQVGSGLTVSGAGNASLAGLNSTDIAFAGPSLNTLRTYRWSGSTWSLVGSALSVTMSAPRATSLTGTRIAIWDYSTNNLRTYDWSGSAWSQVGTTTSVPSEGQCGIAAINTTDIAHAGATVDMLNLYRFNGTTWAEVGAGLSIPSLGLPAMAHLSGSDIALADSSGKLRRYRWTEATTSWSEVGSALTIVAGNPSLTALSPGLLALTDDTGNELRAYTSASLWRSIVAFDPGASGMVSSTLNAAAIEAYQRAESAETAALAAIPAAVEWTGARAVGTGLTIAETGPLITSLTRTDIAFIGEVNDLLMLYRWQNSQTWAAVGAGLSLAAATGPHMICSVNSTDIAYTVANTAATLQMYRWTEGTSTWAAVGSALAIGSVGAAAAAAITPSDIAFHDNTSGNLRTYRFNGSAWSLIGNALSVIAASSSMAALNSTDVAFHDISTDTLRTYRFDGTDWAQVGAALSVPAGAASMTALNSTDIAFIEAANDNLQIYRWDASTGTWAANGDPFYIAGAGGSLAAVNGTDVAHIDSDGDTLQTYRFDFQIGTGPYRP